jgi:hypothetical protein
MANPQIFISYAREDVEAARRLYRDLKNAELNPWLDEEVLLPGQNWKSAIRKAIKESRFFIALLSSNSVKKRGYVQRELKEALDVLLEFPKSAIYVIPARLDDNETDDERLLEIHRVDLFPDWEKGLKKILQAIRVEAEMPLKDASVKSGVKNTSFHDFGVSNRGNISFTETWPCQVCGRPFPSYQSYFEHFESEHK